MNKYLIILLLIFSALGCKSDFNGSKNADTFDSLTAIIDKLQYENERLRSDTFNLIDENEDFDAFIFKYMTDSAFQIERTHFPLTYIHWKDNYPGSEIDTTTLSIKNWKHKYFYMIGFSYIPQLYDNFEMKLRPTDKRLLHFTGVETGTNAKYFFESKDRKWYLTKMENLGD